MEKERTREKDQKSDRHKILLHVSATAPNKNGVTEGIVGLEKHFLSSGKNGTTENNFLGTVCFLFWSLLLLANDSWIMGS